MNINNTASFQELAEKHKTSGMFKYFFFQDPIIVPTDPEIVKVILSDHTHFEKDNDEIVKDVIGNGLLLANGDLWHKSRKLMTPSFGYEYMKFMVPNFAQCTQILIQKWEKLGSANPLDVHSEMTRLTLDVIGVAGFGFNFNAVIDPQGEIPKAVTDLLEISEARIFSVLPFWKLPFWPQTIKFQKAKATVTRVLEKIIENRMKQGKTEQNSEDLLGRLLASEDPETGEKINPRQLRDELMTFLIAGHETTAAMLAFFWLIISTHPSVEKELCQELDEVLQGREPTWNDLPHLKKLDLAIKETMRLYPSVSMQTTRNTVKEYELNGVKIPKNTNVEIWPWLLHRNKDLWENPEIFDLNRFANHHSPFHYLPFGAGSRSCIGQKLALTESKIVISMLLKRFRFRLAPEADPKPKLSITLRPTKLLMYVERKVK